MHKEQFSQNPTTKVTISYYFGSFAGQGSRGSWSEEPKKVQGFSFFCKLSSVPPSNPYF